VLLPETVLNGRYLLEDLIAAGGMGEVWSGVDPSLGRRVAVKVLLPSLLADAAFITRFRTEARTMAALRHPGIVQVYDYGQDTQPDSGTLDYLVMEFIDGTPLSTALRQAGRLSPQRTMEIVAQAADALQVAHEAGIVHRDVKPGNLLIRPDGAVVLVDFGVARSTTGAGITSTNIVMGTAHYMAPEQAEGKPVTPAIDVYALGAVAYCCLAGRTPYVGDGQLEVLDQLVYGPSPTLPPDVPPAVAAVVMRAMAKDPARRYPNAAALAEAARSVLNGQDSTGRATTPAPSPAARVAFLGQDIPQPTTTNQTSEPAPTNLDARTGKNSPTRPGRRLIRTLATLAVGALIGAAWATVSIAFQLADDASQQASTTPNPSQPGPATRNGSTGKPSTPPQTPKPTDSPDPGDPTANPYVPTKLCGSGFNTVDSAPLRVGDELLGSVYLLADDTGTMCVVTLKTVELDEDTPTSAYLQPEDGHRAVKEQSNQFYAGPVREASAGGCVRWGGSVDDVSFDSPLGHCQ